MAGDTEEDSGVIASNQNVERGHGDGAVRQKDISMEFEGMNLGCSDDHHQERKETRAQWMKLYKNAKYGLPYDDLNLISERDLGIWIESGKSAMDIAAFYGQQDLFEQMADQLVYVGDDEYVWLLMNAMNWACQGDQPDIVGNIFQRLLNTGMFEHRDCYSCMSDDRFRSLYQTAVTFSCPSALQLIEKLIDPHKMVKDLNQTQAIFTAFFYGRKANLTYLVNQMKFAPEHLAETFAVPLLLVLIALGDTDEAEKEIDKNVEEWYLTTTFTIETNTASLEVDAFVIGAKFFREEMMDLLLRRSMLLTSPDFEADRTWKIVFTQAISVDDHRVLVWLEKNHLAEIRPGYELDLQQQCLIKPQGDIFNYLRKKFPQPCSSREMMEKMMLACFSTCYRGCTDLALYYLSLVTDVYNSEYTQYCLKVAIFSETPDIVEILLESVDWSCDHPSGVMHDALRWALQCGPSRNKRLPSPAMVELILSKLPPGSACQCCECVLFDLFFEYLEYDETETQFNRERSLLTSMCIQDHIKIIITQLVEHGAKPRLDAIRSLFTRFFTYDTPRSYFSSRLYWIADWYDLSEMNLDHNKYPLWFLSDFEDRDEFIAQLLQSMSGNKRRTIRWDGLLVYILKPEARRLQMKTCIRECGLVIDDEMFKRLPPEIKETEAYKDVQTLCKPSMISLLSLSRLSIMRDLRKKTTQYRRSHPGEFVPLSLFTQKWCERETVPHLICHYFEFCDVYHKWKYNLGNRLHEDFRTVIEEVFVQFHLDR